MIILFAFKHHWVTFMKKTIISIIALLLLIPLIAHSKEDLSGIVEKVRCYYNDGHNDAVCGIIIIDAKSGQSLALVDTEISMPHIVPELWRKLKNYENKLNASTINIPKKLYWNMSRQEQKNMPEIVDYYLKLQPDHFYFCNIEKLVELIDRQYSE